MVLEFRVYPVDFLFPFGNASDTTSTVLSAKNASRQL